MITERYRGHGRFDLRLSDDTPSDVVTQLVEFGHVVITDSPVDPAALGDSGMLAAARYTGVVYRPARRLDLSVRLAGYGPLIHLGDQDGKGDIIETPWRPTASWTFADWINGLLGTINGTPSPLQPGTVTNVAPPSSGDRTIYVRYLNRRQVLDYIVDYYSASYRVNPDFTVDAGPESALFNVTPTVVLFDRAGEDPVTDGLPATVLDVEWDADDWTSRVVLFGEGQQTETIVVGTADVATNPYKDPQGNPLVRKRPVSSPITESGEASVVAQAQLNRFANVSGVVTAATDHPRIRSLVQPGDNIWAWFPEGRVVDTSQQTTHRGELLSPLVLRVWEIRWPVREGMGVYYRDADGNYIDLTPYVRWETGQARLKVGAPSKRIISRESPAVPDRTWTTPVTTPNIASQAVTVTEMSDPVWTDMQLADANNVAIDTTWRNYVTNTHTIPSWVGTANLWAILRFQGSLSATGTKRNMQLGITTDGSAPTDANSQTIHEPDSTSVTFRVHQETFVAPGSTISVYGWTNVNLGTLNDNQVRLQSFVVGLR